MPRVRFWLHLPLLSFTLVSWTSPLGAACTRTTRASLSPIAAAVLTNIEVTTGAVGNSPVPLANILSTCNRFVSVHADGPNIYSAARDMIGLANHEVDIVYYKWDPTSQAATLIGDGLIAAQARRTAADPLLVRILINGSSIDALWTTRNTWVSRGLDPTRVLFQFAGSPQPLGTANLHDKFIVVDASRILVTGANVEIAHDSPTPWHDSGYRLEGNVGQSALAAFEHTWNNDSIHWVCVAGVGCTQRLSHFPLLTRPWMLSFGADQLGDIPVLAVGRGKESLTSNNTNNPQDLAWLTAIDRAVSTIHIESPNLNDDDFRAAIVRALGRGVTVQLIAALGFNQVTSDLPTQGGDNEEVIGDLRQWARATGFADRFQVRWYSWDGLEPVYKNGPRANHTKYLSVDGKIAIVGSGNMETPAWNWSHEFNVLIDDPTVTASLEAALFQPDWARSIGSYVELYEGNSGLQSLVCPISVMRSKGENGFVPITDPPPHAHPCENDEARSLLLVDVPAGKVLRFYDDPTYGFPDDDWTEILVKRFVARRYVDTFETSFEDADLRVIVHRDDGLDGKVSSMEVATAAIGPVVDLYEGNNALQNLVCSNRVTGPRTINLTLDAYCNNDEARSLKLYDLPTSKVLFVYDDSTGSTTDDWAVIVPQRAILETTVGTFENSVQNADVRVCFFPKDGLDGKVSRVRIGDRSEAYGLCGVAPPTPCVCGEASCSGIASAYISHFTGPDCTGTESYYTPYFGNDGLRRSWDGGGCAGTTLRTVTNRSWKDANGVCSNAWPNGNTLSGFVSIYRCNCGEATCRQVAASYISHFTGTGCTGEEYYYTPYFASDGIRRSWNGTGCVGDLLRTVTVRSWKSSSGVCSNSWPTGNTLSGFVRVYR